MKMLEVKIDGLALDMTTNSPVVILSPADLDRVLPIWIGHAEAWAIAMELSGVKSNRPMTHDLLKLVTESLGGNVDRVVVTDLRDGTFFADLVMSRDTDEVTVSARPSDAIALAARTSSPVFAARAVLDEGGVELRDEGQEEEIERFREFLEDIQPEDFEGGSSS